MQTGSILASICLCLLLFCNKAKPQSILIFAPASTQSVLDKALASYCPPKACLASYASSSLIARQMAEAAPADIYVSAHPYWMDYLITKEVLVKKSRTRLFSNRLVLIANIQSPLMSSLQAIKSHNKQGNKQETKKTHLPILRQYLAQSPCWALGDPTHVPVGLYARKALEYMGHWQHIQANLVPATNARQALYYVESGECPLGIVYQSDAHNNSKVKTLVRLLEKSHQRIRYEIALSLQAHPQAKDLFYFLTSQKVQPLYQKFGFQL